MFPSGYPVSRKVFNNVPVDGRVETAERGIGALAVIVKIVVKADPVCSLCSVEVIPKAVCPRVTNTQPGTLTGVLGPPGQSSMPEYRGAWAKVFSNRAGVWHRAPRCHCSETPATRPAPAPWSWAGVQHRHFSTTRVAQQRVKWKQKITHHPSQPQGEAEAHRPHAVGALPASALGGSGTGI